jgi:predicted TIM-barrel fold metal-dependent hydrolase
VIPLFDSLAHPTVDGRWLSGDRDARVAPLLASLRESGFGMACAVGLAGTNGYDHERFAALCRPHAALVPIAGIDPRAPDLAAQLDVVRDLGFRGIKLHPRRSGFALDDARFVDALRLAHARDLVVMLCTYLHAPIADYPRSDPLYLLAAALREVPAVRMILVHGGDVDLLRWMQLARHNENLVLDVSFTMMKYAGSSLDADLRYAFSSFHRRTCLGSDHPEWAHAAVRTRFEELTAGLPDDARADVGHRTLARFLGVEEAWR